MQYIPEPFVTSYLVLAGSMIIYISTLAWQDVGFEAWSNIGRL